MVDLDDLLHRLACDPVALRGARVRSHDDTALEAECQRGGAVGELDGAVGVGVVISMGAEEGVRLVIVSGEATRDHNNAHVSHRRQGKLQRQ